MSAARHAREAEGRAEEAPTFFLLGEPALPGSTVELPPEEAHHALRVLRLEGGVVVPATDGRGARYRLRLAPSGGSCAAEVLERVDEAPAAPRVEVGVGAGRRERFLWCVEKLTELEVARLTPLLARAVQGRRGLEGEGGRRLAERARARAAAALKQSKGAHLPEISLPEDATVWARRSFDGRPLLLALPAPGIPSLAAAVAGALRQALPFVRAFRLAVGPEGGFLAEEEAAFTEAGFARVHLGRRRLRFETAAVAGVCQVRAIYTLAASGASLRE